eukprot:CAMPEP_0195247190 /NCGR_PEP_ID=MMETSP0706-20130129/827_1 /TAXON_ID=33640 /ORGANISM="Asterionellopsis glacialis, Strain CCMP134" /LENGTH=326 /DNA_ID=CAMNT_0040298663 /DNA_START=12 /DNA_END=992 /DNA_ORIENTATION=-
MIVSILQFLLLCMPMGTKGMLRGVKKRSSVQNRRQAIPMSSIRDEKDSDEFAWNVPGFASANAQASHCEVSVEVICRTEYDESCNDMLPEIINICQESPSSLTLHYKGGDCQQGNYDLCTDHQKEVLIPGLTPYIVATSSDEDEIYFQGFVGTDDAFVVKSGNNQGLSSDIVIKTYQSEEKSNAIQTVVLPTSCSNDDSFFGFAENLGSLELIAFTNEERGEVTRESIFEVRVNLIYIIYNPDLMGPVTLESLRSLTNADTNEINLDIQVGGESVGSRKTIVVSEGINLDLTKREVYTFITNIGASAGNESCNQIDSFEFTAGLDL